MTNLRVVIADDERPARSFLAGILRSFEGVELVGEAANGAECVEVIERLLPDLALLDLQMPEVDGLGVVRLLRKEKLPLIAFVTAYDEYAVRAFEMNAVDYLLKPVDPVRLRSTINRAVERLERAELRPGDADRIRAAATDYVASLPPTLLRRIPVSVTRRHFSRAGRTGRFGGGRRRAIASHDEDRRTIHHHLSVEGPGDAPRPGSNSCASRAERC